MGVGRAVRTHQWRWPAAAALEAGAAQRHFLAAASRQRLAPAAPRFAALAHGLQTVRGLARGRYVG